MPSGCFRRQNCDKSMFCLFSKKGGLRAAPDDGSQPTKWQGMNLREFHSLWADKSMEDIREKFPGPFLLVNWPAEAHVADQRLVVLAQTDGAAPVEQLIGRSASAEITIREAGVSSRHALLQPSTPKPGSPWSLLDLCSTNGSYINKERLNSGTPYPLEDKQLVVLGTDVEVRFMSLEAIYELFKSFDMEHGRKRRSKRSSTERINRAAVDKLLPHGQAVEPLSVSDAPILGMTRAAFDPSASYWVQSEGHEAVELKAGAPCIIGRGDNTDIKLSHPLVSRRHLAICIEETGITLEDLGSANGTIVGTREIFGQKLSIEPGHPFWLGPFRLEINKRAGEVSGASGPTGKGSDTQVFAFTQVFTQTHDKGQRIIFAGGISDMPITEVLQGIEFNEKSGTLVIEGDTGQGCVVFRDGRPVYSTLAREGAEDAAGEDALLLFLGATNGSFSFVGNDDAPETNVTIRVSRLLMDWSRIQDETSATT